MSYIQKMSVKDVRESDIVKVEKRGDITIHHTKTKCCYIEIEGDEKLIILASPCPFKK